jgi:hypothetical protein
VLLQSLHNQLHNRFTISNSSVGDVMTKYEEHDSFAISYSCVVVFFCLTVSILGIDCFLLFDNFNIGTVQYCGTFVTVQLLFVIVQ